MQLTTNSENASSLRAPAAPPVEGRQLAVVCNPRSGRVTSRLGKVRALGQALAGANYREASSPAEIDEALSTLAVGEETYLGIVGGDGTVQAVLTSLHRQRPDGDWPTLFIAPGGSTNMTAKDVGGSGSVLNALEDLTRWCNEEGSPGTVVRRAVLCADRNGEDPVCGMFFGLGWISEGVQFFKDNLRGKAFAGEYVSWLSVGRVMLSLGLGRGRSRVLSVTTTVDGGLTSPHDCAFCLTTSLNRLLFGTRPYWGEGPGPLHFTMVDGGADRLWRNIPGLARGRPGRRMHESAGYTSHNASTVELAFQGPFVIDGELYSTRASDSPVRLSAPHSPRWLAL